jgi:hypothetical protein
MENDDCCFYCHKQAFFIGEIRENTNSSVYYRLCRRCVEDDTVFYISVFPYIGSVPKKHRPLSVGVLVRA